MKPLLVALVCIAALSELSSAARSQEQAARFDWRSDWALKPGFAVEIDTENYEFPTAIAFVPDGGHRPKEPLYFVTELKGRIKVVTNDRTVFTFAENFFRLERRTEQPAGEGEIGLAGICLAPEQGYIFVTFAYQDRDGILRNNVVRFESKPKTFSLRPIAMQSFAEIFMSDVSAPSHQIGACQVSNGELFVSVGDGHQPRRSQQIDSTLGKILRMTLDGDPVQANPFYGDDRRTNPSNYVWAYGFRNPFGLRIVGSRVFVAENGPSVDRFIEARRGENHLWDGTDWSIGSNAIVVFKPSVAPVQTDYYSGDRSIFPREYRSTFFVAFAGTIPGPPQPGVPGVGTVHYASDTGRIRSVPEYFLWYRGKSPQIVAGLAIGRDGLYVAPIYPNQEGRSGILRITYAPGRQHPFIIGQDPSPFALMSSKGCLGCHSGTSAPRLDGLDLIPRLRKRLHTKEYEEFLRALDRQDVEPVRRYRAARREVIRARGLERVRIWMRHKIQTPGFDNLRSLMPDLGVSEREASVIAEYLLGQGSVEMRFIAWVHRAIPVPRYRHILLALAGGFASAALLALVGWRILGPRR